VEQAEDIPIELHVEAHRHHWRKATEPMPSVVHIGYFNAHEQLWLLSVLDAALAKLPFELGYLLARWKEWHRNHASKVFREL
jgi:hypothetical protein